MSANKLEQACQYRHRTTSFCTPSKQMSFSRAGCFRVVPFISQQTSYHTWRPIVPTAVRNHCTSTAPNPEPQILRQSSMEKVEQILQHRFSDRSLLAQALAHRSVVSSTNQNVAWYEDGDKKLRIISKNNERLELLGDRVFGLLATQVLYEREEDKSEGDLTKTLQFILSRQTADKYFRFLGLDQHMLEADNLKGGQGSRYGDCFEALLAALFLDGGYEVARTFFQSRVVPTCDIFAGDYTDTNYKQKLQEYLVSQGLPAPALATRVKYNPISYDQNARLFSQSIKLFGRRVSIGVGPTRVSADQDAARRLLMNLQNCMATCFLIRLARRANDQRSLAKLQAVRAAQIAADATEVSSSS